MGWGGWNPSPEFLICYSIHSIILHAILLFLNCNVSLLVRPWRRKTAPSEILVKRLYTPDCKISLAFFVQYLETILPSVDRKVYFMGGGAVGVVWRHQQWSPSWSPRGLIWKVKLFLCWLKHRQPERTMCGFGLQRSLGRNILELLVYYLIPNECKKLKDMKSSCLSVYYMWFGPLLFEFYHMYSNLQR